MSVIPNVMQLKWINREREKGKLSDGVFVKNLKNFGCSY